MRIDVRQSTALGLAVVLPALLAVVLVPLRGQVNLVSDMLLFLLITVIVAFTGGLLPALVAAVVSSALLNYWFTPPLHTLSIRDGNNALALAVFVLVAGLVSSAVDLAGRRTRQASAAENEARVLAAGNDMRNALLAAAGHDLRTPLSAAKASVSSLRSDRDFSAADRDDLLAAADESLDRLADLVGNLLDMSRLQAGVLSLVRAPTAVEDVVARSLRGLGVDGRRIDVEYTEDLPLVRADAGLLERVLENLFTNALRYSPGRPAVRFTVLDGRLQVHVVDHGPGIRAEDREQVFLPFQRLGDTGGATRGIGLGLAVARGLTEAMAGTLEPTETPGGGLTMVLSLELAGHSA